MTTDPAVDFDPPFVPLREPGDRREAREFVVRSLTDFVDGYDVDAIVEQVHLIAGTWKFESGISADAYWGIVARHVRADPDNAYACAQSVLMACGWAGGRDVCATHNPTLPGCSCRRQTGQTHDPSCALLRTAVPNLVATAQPGVYRSTPGPDVSYDPATIRTSHPDGAASWGQVSVWAAHADHIAAPDEGGVLWCAAGQECRHQRWTRFDPTRPGDADRPVSELFVWLAEHWGCIRHG